MKPPVPQFQDDEVSQSSKASASTNNSSAQQAVQIQGGNVIVVTRVRPLNRKEIEMGTNICLDFHPNRKDITLNLSQEGQGAFGSNKFNFDRIFDVNSTQKEIYDIAAKPIIESK
jgi:hypothetical protein